jgi:hypothetical protein
MAPRNTMEDFQRDVSYRILKQDDGNIALTATLKDPFHDIEIKVTVDSGSMQILAATVAFHRAPSTDCIHVTPRLERLIGVTIGPGLTRKLTETFGGREGCGNLKNLFQGLLPLAINARAAAGFDNDGEMLAAIHEKLLGTCAGYVKKDKDS